jgi:AcrR family transcriptional regulator
MARLKAVLRAAAERRQPLNRERVLGAAVALADEIGVEALSMRKLAEALGVVPMALYKHVANKEELLDGMVDVVIGEIEAPISGADWKTAVRHRILAARRALRRHPWASRVIESRTNTTTAVLDYMNSMIGLFRSGGFSADFTHHAMHAMGSRLLGFTQELFDDSRPLDPQTLAVLVRELGPKYPHVLEIAMAASHDEGSVVGQGCDDQFEFEFALDLLLDGLESRHRQGWTPVTAGGTTGHKTG